MKSLLTARIGLLLLTHRAWTFSPSNTPAIRRPFVLTSADQHTRHFTPQIYASKDNDDDSAYSEKDSIVPSSKRRAGGRVRNKKRPSTAAVEKAQRLPGWVKNVLVPVVALWFLSQIVFGGDSSSSNYYYYQSSVYESSMYGAEGRVETSRRESVRTNIPRLVGDKDEEQSRLPTIRNNLLLDYEQRADDKFDRELDQEIESMIRMQRQFLHDFW